MSKNDKSYKALLFFLIGLNIFYDIGWKGLGLFRSITLDLILIYIRLVKKKNKTLIGKHTSIFERIYVCLVEPEVLSLCPP